MRRNGVPYVNGMDMKAWIALSKIHIELGGWTAFIQGIERVFKRKADKPLFARRV